MNEADIPIDIHTGKLLEWLISRRIVPKNTTQVREIRNKIANAVKDMPENEGLIKLLSGAHINYFHCQRIIEILKQTEKDTKSVFGSYGSQRMKDWQEIVKLYEKENIYLFEAAQILVRNLTFEIPSLKKQMTKLEQQSDEALKKIQDLGKSENVFLSEHAALCHQLGIKGENLEQELKLKLQELPKIYTESISNMKELKESVDLYAECIKNTNCLPIIRHLAELGNTTVYQYIHKEAPLTIEEPPICLNLRKENTESVDDSGEIDFGIDLNETAGGAETIDFEDLGAEEITLDTGIDIDWGESGQNASNEQEINFDVPLDDYGIVVEGVGIDGGVAKGDSAYTILDSPNYREKFIDELYELESFLKLRNYELATLENSNNIVFAFMDDNLSTHDSKSISKMVKSAEAIISKVTTEQTQHLFHLKHSPKYANLLTSKLEQKLVAVEKIKKTKEVLKENSIEFREKSVALKPALSKMMEQTRVLQGQIEKDISKRYKNRFVNLMGGVSCM